MEERMMYERKIVRVTTMGDAYIGRDGRRYSTSEDLRCADNTYYRAICIKIDSSKHLPSLQESHSNFFN
jgi:hypothetical protein